MIFTHHHPECQSTTPGVSTSISPKHQVAIIAGWWWVKIIGVLAMSAFHGKLVGWRRDFMEDRNMRPERYYRIANEVPTLLMFVIVIMVIVRPF